MRARPQGLARTGGLLGSQLSMHILGTANHSRIERHKNLLCGGPHELHMPTYKLIWVLAGILHRKNGDKMRSAEEKKPCNGTKKVKRLRTSIVLALVALAWDDLYLDSGRATKRCTVLNTGP